MYSLDYGDCVQVIVSRMKRYQESVEVQEAGCDALKDCAKTAVDARAFVDRDACGAVCRALEAFPNKGRVVWKACSAIYDMSHPHPALASEFGKHGAVDHLTTSWDVMVSKKDVAMQQQILWAFAGLSTNAVNVERFKRNYKAVAILKYVLVEVPRNNRTKKAKKTTVQLVLPVALQKLFTRDEIEKYSEPPEPPPEKKEEKKKFSMSFLRPKPKKAKFGRISDAPETSKQEGESGLM